MFRDYVGHSIAIFFSLAALFFAMTFLIGIGKDTKTQNSIDNQVPLQQAEVDRWGTIPGKLDYTFTRSAQIYSVASYKNEILNLNLQGPYLMDVNRTFVGPYWDPTKQVVSYSMDYNYSGVSDSELSTQYKMFNLAGMSVWYQKVHKPQYWFAWQALAQASNLMFTSNLLTRYYAYNSYYYIFQTPSLVYSGVLAGLSPADQVTVYTDPKCGMDNPLKLTFWIQANIGGSSSTAYTDLQTYFATKGVILSDPIMQQIVGPQSVIQFIVTSMKIAIINTRSLD